MTKDKLCYKKIYNLEELLYCSTKNLITIIYCIFCIFDKKYYFLKKNIPRFFRCEKKKMEILIVIMLFFEIIYGIDIFRKLSKILEIDFVKIPLSRFFFLNILVFKKYEHRKNKLTKKIFIFGKQYFHFLKSKTGVKISKNLKKSTKYQYKIFSNIFSRILSENKSFFFFFDIFEKKVVVNVQMNPTLYSKKLLNQD